jgi:antitoxin (DNA-binding transcriptional repressor) of toxin-antitoxin stability system
MNATHISIAELSHHADKLAERVRNGEQIILDSDSRPIAMLVPVPAPHGRLTSESIAILKERAETRGFEAIMDDEFAADMEAIIAARKPRDTSVWD